MNPTNLKPGEERHEKFKNVDGLWWFDLNYRHTNGELFRKISRSLKACRDAKDKWIKKQGK